LSNKFGIEYKDNLLGNASALPGKGTMVDESGWENIPYRNKQPSSKSNNATAIPYYA
jgi:hypothetical protein